MIPHHFRCHLRLLPTLKFESKDREVKPGSHNGNSIQVMHIPSLTLVLWFFSMCACPDILIDMISTNNSAKNDDNNSSHVPRVHGCGYNNSKVSRFSKIFIRKSYIYKNSKFYCHENYPLYGIKAQTNI